MKYLVLFVVFASFGAIAYGFSLGDDYAALSHKFIGFGVVGLFFIAMPLFLYKESKGKNVKDYMLTEENILKMNAREKQKNDTEKPSENL